MDKITFEDFDKLERKPFAENLTKVKYRLAILKLIVELLSCMWIIAGIASTYYLVMAIGFNGEWTSFFWALGVGVVCKWLARGFDENQRRIQLETETSNNMSPENKQAADRRILIISDFGRFIESDSVTNDIGFGDIIINHFGNH